MEMKINAVVALSRIFLRKMELTKAMCDGDYFCPSMKLKDLNLHNIFTK